MKLVVAVTGASGAAYARRLLEALELLRRNGDAPLEDVGVCLSPTAERIWADELGTEPSFPFRRWALDNFDAPFASGSAGWNAMVVLPCSTGTLGRIAHGISSTLIGRAADVMLKERQKLVLVVRETPLSIIHLDNMVAVTRAGAVVMPACPSFYTKPTTVSEVVDTVVARVLDHLGLRHDLLPRWGQDAR